MASAKAGAITAFGVPHPHSYPGTRTRGDDRFPSRLYGAPPTPGSKPPHHERREDAPNVQRKRRQFLRGFQARPGDRARNAAHRDRRRCEPVHRALRLALRRAVVRRLCANRSAIRTAPIDDMLVFHIVLGKTVPDISRNAIANLGYADLRFLKAVYPGDTLSTTTEIIGLKENSNRKNGTVYVRSTGRNQRGEPVLSFSRWVMVNKRDEMAPAPEPHVPELIARSRAVAARRCAAEPQARRLRLCACRLGQALGRLQGRRQDRPCRRADHRGGRASARHAPVPEHGAGAFQSAHRGARPFQAPHRLWRPRHLHRARLELQRARQCLPSRRASMAGGTWRRPLPATPSMPGARSPTKPSFLAAPTWARCACACLR